MAARKMDLPMGGTAQVEDVQIVRRKEEVAEYELDDGSVIRIANPLMSVVRVQGQFDPMGNPTYFVFTQTVQLCVKSEDIMKKPKENEVRN